MSLTKPWSEHLKANIVPIIGMVGSFIYFGHLIDSNFLELQSNQEQAKVFQIETKNTLKEMKGQQDNTASKLDTLQVEFREYKMQMDYRLELESLNHHTSLVTERHTPKGLAFITAK
jgi:hypothetical protein